MKYGILLILCYALCGCTTSSVPSAGGSPRTAEGEAARAIVEKYVGDSEPKTGGPLTKQGDEDLRVLIARDREKANELLSQGAIGFVVYVPDYSLTTQTDKNHQNIFKIGRIVFVKENRVVGDFWAQ
jgi:hypothetical protein